MLILFFWSTIHYIIYRLDFDEFLFIKSCSHRFKILILIFRQNAKNILNYQAFRSSSTNCLDISKIKQTFSKPKPNFQLYSLIFWNCLKSLMICTSIHWELQSQIVFCRLWTFKLFENRFISHNKFLKDFFPWLL